MTVLLKKINSLLFGATDSKDLNLFRVLFSVALIFQLASDFPWHVNTVSNGLDFNPIPLFEIFGIPRISSELFTWLGALLIVSLVLAGLGIATRVCLISGCILYFFYFGTVLSFFKSPHTNYVWHTNNIVVPVLFVLACAPGVNRFGVGRLLQRTSKQVHLGPFPDWPRFAVILTLGLAYFGAGYVKLVTSGPLWADGYTMQHALLEKFVMDDIPIAMGLARYYWICLLIGVFTLLIELTFVVVAFIPKLTRVYVTAGLGLHLGIYAIMNINFLHYFGFVYLVFLRWEHVRKVLRYLLPGVLLRKQ